MTRLYLLDTNTVSYILKGQSSAARSRLAALGPAEMACMSVITEAELLYGVAKSGIGEQRQKALQWFLGRLQVLTWGREDAAAYGMLGRSKRLRAEAWERSIC